MTMPRTDQRVLIAGGTGVVGSDIADLLVEAGAGPIVLDNLVRCRAANLDRARAVGPCTSIGADVRIRGTEVEHPIGMDGTMLRFPDNPIDTSIIDRGAGVVRHFDLPSARRMSIGDGAAAAR